MASITDPLLLAILQSTYRKEPLHTFLFSLEELVELYNDNADYRKASSKKEFLESWNHQYCYFHRNEIADTTSDGDLHRVAKYAPMKDGCLVPCAIFSYYKWYSYIFAVDSPSEDTAYYEVKAEYTPELDAWQNGSITEVVPVQEIITKYIPKS